MIIKKLKNRFEIIRNEISQLVEGQYYFKQYTEYIEKSKSVDKNQDFLRFISDNYKLLALINVYKQVDARNDVESLIMLLEAIKENKNLFTLKWYKRQWKPVPIAKTNKKISRAKEAEEYFKEFSIKNNGVISSQKIDEDIREIKKTINGKRFGKHRQSISSLTKYRHKRGAHYAAGKPKVNVPVEDLYKAIDLLEKMTLKYGILINKEGMDTLLASNVDCFLEFNKIFKE